MALFWFVATLMLVLAMGIITWPVIRQQRSSAGAGRKRLNILIHREHLQELEKDYADGLISKDELENTKYEIELGLISDVTEDAEVPKAKTSYKPGKTLVLILCAFPVAVIFIYLLLGNTGMITAKPQRDIQQAVDDGARSIEGMVAGLSARLEQHPEDPVGWEMLGRSLLVMGRYPDAVHAYRQARKYAGDEPQLLANYAEALLMANDNNLTEEAEGLIRLSLKADPKEPKALWIAGYGNYMMGNLEQTLIYWNQLLELFKPGSKEYISMRRNIQQVKLQQSKQEPTAAPETGTVSAGKRVSGNAVAVNTAINVHVSIDEGLQHLVKPDDTVFIFARAANGPRMPLAIASKKARELPFQVTLDDSMAMAPNMNISAFEQIIIGARISKTGQAMPASGDLSGKSDIIKTSEITGVRVTIDQLIP